jgi:hypothetical protein
MTNPLRNDEDHICARPAQPPRVPVAGSSYGHRTRLKCVRSALAYWDPLIAAILVGKGDKRAVRVSGATANPTVGTSGRAAPDSSREDGLVWERQAR